MIDYLMRFATEAAARTALAPLGFCRQDEQGIWRWDTSRVIPNVSKITQEAKWDNSVKPPILISAEQKSSGYWMLVALSTENLQVASIAQNTATRGLTVKLVNGARIAPVFAGSVYTPDSVRLP